MGRRSWRRRDPSPPPNPSTLLRDDGRRVRRHLGEGARGQSARAFRPCDFFVQLQYQQGLQRSIFWAMIPGTMGNRIIFNGKEYQSVDEMPPDIRRAYEGVMGIFADKDANGLPDLLEGHGNDISPRLTNIFHDGMVYHSIEDLPPEARAKYQAAMEKLDQDGNGIPDLVESLDGRLAGTGKHVDRSQTEPDPSQAAPIPKSSPVMEEVGINWKTFILTLAITGIVILAIAAGWEILTK